MRFRPTAAGATTNAVSRKKNLQEEERRGREKVVAGSGRGAKKSSVGFDNNQQFLLEISEVPWYTKCLVSFFMAYAGKNVESLLLSSLKSADIRLPPYLVLVVLLNFQFLSQVFLPVKKKLLLLFRQCLFCLAERILLFPPQKKKTTKKKPQIYARLDPPTTHTLLEPPRVFPRRRPRFEESSY